MKRQALICLIVILILIPAMIVNCSSDGSVSLENNVNWTETTYPFNCTYEPPPEGYINDGGDYKVNLGGQVRNTSNGTVEISSVIFRLYNSAGKIVLEKIFDGCKLESNQHSSVGFEEQIEEEVVRYEVFVTDSEGTEYSCATD